MASSVAMARGGPAASTDEVDASGSISRAVSSSAASPALSITVLDSSTRVTSPCEPTNSTSYRSAAGSPLKRRRKLWSTSSTYSGPTKSLSGLPITSAAFMPNKVRKRELANRIWFRCTRTASCTVSTRR